MKQIADSDLADILFVDFDPRVVFSCQLTAPAPIPLSALFTCIQRCQRLRQ